MVASSSDVAMEVAVKLESSGIEFEDTSEGLIEAISGLVWFPADMLYSERLRWLREAPDAADYVDDEWSVEDILDPTEETEQVLTVTDAREVITRIKRHLDTEVGINWRVVDSYVDDVLLDRT